MNQTLKYLALFLGAIANAALADQNSHDLLGVSPGKKSEFKSESYGAPFDKYLKPTQSSSLAQVFSDLEIIVLKSNGKIAGVGAKRAYGSVASCETDRGVVGDMLKKTYPTKYNGPDDRWQYASSDMEITAGVICNSYKLNPYPVLRLDITHTETNNALLKSFE